MRIVTLLLFVLVAVVALAASAGAAGSKTAVSVKLFEFKVIPTPTKAARGAVTFVARNSGKVDHQLVVLKTNIPPGKLVVKNAKAVETGKVGSIRVVKPGKAVALTLQLKAGKYVLLCNLPGHYPAGQRAAFTVS
jgi:uncharacterized cupredoxin-like copper-binding protein